MSDLGRDGSSSASLLLAVHDEVLVTSPPACADQAQALIEAAMSKGMAAYFTAVL